MRKFRRARLLSRRSAITLCPNCGETIEGYTGVEFDFVPGPVNTKDHFTMCVYCGEFVMFTDNAGHIRRLSDQEAADYKAWLAEPDQKVIRDLYAAARARAKSEEMKARESAERLTKVWKN